MSEVKKPPLSVYKKLLEIQREVIGLQKDSNGFGFKYVSGNKIINYIKPLMNKLELLLLVEIDETSIKREDYTVFKKQWVDNGQGQKTQKEVPTPKSEILVKANILFTWVCVETGQELRLKWDGIGFNDWDKGIGSAVTYSERYFLLKTFHISTDEDDIDNPQINEDKRLRAIEDKINSTFSFDGLANIHNSLTDADKLLFRASLSTQKENIKRQLLNQQQNNNQYN